MACKILPKFELRDEDGFPFRRFYSRIQAKRFLTDGYTLVKLNLPKPPSDYEIGLSTFGESPF